MRMTDDVTERHKSLVRYTRRVRRLFQVNLKDDKQIRSTLYSAKCTVETQERLTNLIH